MAATPLLIAVTSTRQLLFLLRCISFARKAQVRISADGIRFSTEDGSVMEAFVFLEKKLFTTYTYNAPARRFPQDGLTDPAMFEVSMIALLETLSIFTLSDPSNAKRPAGETYDPFAAHRLNRHAGINAFSNAAAGVSGICTFTYDGEGSPLSIHMSESNVTTTCDLTTYAAGSTEEIPFDRESIALKTIMRSTHLLDAISELSTLNPDEVTIHATPNPSRASNAHLSLAASGALGSANVDFTTNTISDEPVLQTIYCPERTEASFKFSLIRSAQRAMASATKVSLRLDEQSVLSLQFLIELDPRGSGGRFGAGLDNEPPTAFVDFRVVPLVDDDHHARVDVGAGDESTDDDV